jgi:hypothetical protein
MNSATSMLIRLVFGVLLIHTSYLAAQNPDFPYSSGSTGADGALTLLTPPSARYQHALAFDSNRQRTVLFGGNNGSVNLNDTWEWDGINWTQKTPTTSPSARSYHALVYDAARQRVVLFGGNNGSVNLNDTWEWDGTNWILKSPTSSPSIRSGHAMTYDTIRQRVVLFGGSADNFVPNNETWEWDGTNWTLKTPAASPSIRHYHALAYDAARQRVVFFGGYYRNYNVPYNDTWEWDGTNWSQKSPFNPPSARLHHALAYDASHQRVVLFGGYSTSGANFNETWEWDGTTWSQKSLKISPSARQTNGGMAYDSTRQRMVLFGGYPGGVANDTWEWDGTNWIGGGGTHFFDMAAKANGVWNYTSITIGAGVKLTFPRNTANTPVTWLASGDVKIDGELNLDGTQTPGYPFGSNLIGNQGKGGPGGFDGGLGGTRFSASGSYAGTPGQGPGGGGSGISSGQDGTSASSNYGNSYLQPLVGGSGGGGSGSSDTQDGGNGGGGGGAILISSSRDLAVNGTIHANGGDGSWGDYNSWYHRIGFHGGSGSGGAIRLVGDRVLGTGRLEATSPSGASNYGKLRIEGYIRSLLQTGTASHTPTVSAPVVTAPSNTQPALAVTSVAGQPVAQPPTGNPASPDVVFSSAGSITITVTATNIPDTTPVTCRVTSGSQIISLPINGDPAVTLSGGTATFTTTVQAGIGSIQAFCSFTTAP